MTTREVKTSITGKGPTLDHALADAYDTVRLKIHDLVDRQFGSVEARGWEISGHAIVLEHQTTHLRGQLEAHAYDNGAPVVEVKCWAEITVTIVEVTRRKARR